MELNGIFNIIKPAGFTSHDVVAIVRRTIGMKKVGHLGTLDPMATGVLPVAVGNSTRTMDFLDLDIKVYKCRAALGLGSDTYDIWAKSFVEGQVPQPSEEALEDFIRSYTNVVEQRPPIYSALKKNGKKLYEYARAGQEVQIDSRKVYIKSIKTTSRWRPIALRELLEYNSELELEAFGEIKPLVIDLEIQCSKGTYIRTICNDLGQFFNTQGIMLSLDRLQSGIFTYENGISLDDFQQLSEEKLRELIIPSYEAMSSLGKIIISDADGQRYKNGCKISKRAFIERLQGEANIGNWPLELDEAMERGYRIFTENGSFLGVGLIMENGSLRPLKSMA